MSCKITPLLMACNISFNVIHINFILLHYFLNAFIKNCFYFNKIFRKFISFIPYCLFEFFEKVIFIFFAILLYSYNGEIKLILNFFTDHFYIKARNIFMNTLLTGDFFSTCVILPTGSTFAFYVLQH